MTWFGLSLSAAGVVMLAVALFALLGWIPVAVIGVLLIPAGLLPDWEALGAKHPRTTPQRR